MVRFDPADAFDRRNSRRRSARAGARRLAAAVLSHGPIDQPLLDPANTPAPAARRSARAKPQNQLLSGLFRRGRGLPNASAVGADAGFEAAFRAGAGLALFDRILAPSIRRSPACCASAWPCAPPPPAPRWRAIARILPRCATPNIFRPTPAGTRPPAPPGACIGCGAVSPRGPVAVRRPKPAPGRRSARTAARPRSSRRWPGRCGVSRKSARKSFGGGGARGFDDDANCWTARHASKPRFWRCG